MSTREHLKLVTAWLADLANLTAGTAPLLDAKTKITAMAGLLADDFPNPGAFTKKSLHEIGRELTFFPAYAVLHKALSDWWSANKPAPPLLPGSDDPDLSEMDRRHIKSWHNLRPEGDLTRRLGTYRDKWPEAYRYIIRTDAEAEAISRRMGWVAADAPIDVSEEAIGRNLIKLEQAIQPDNPSSLAIARYALLALRKAVEVRAPHNLHLIPDTIEAVRKPTEPSPRQQDDEAFASAEAQKEKLVSAVNEAKAAFIAEHGRPPGALSREQLDASRVAAGIRPPAVKPSGAPQWHVAPNSDQQTPMEPAVAQQSANDHVPWRAPWDDPPEAA